MIKGILFDKDGTLIDFSETFGPATAAVIRTLANGDMAIANRMASAVDFDLDEQTFANTSIIIAGTCADQAEVWGKIINRPDSEVLAGELDTLFARYATEFVTPFQETELVLDHLLGLGLLIGLGTNDSEIGARNQIEKMRFQSKFGFIAGYDSGHGAKPGPGMINAFAAHCRAAPGEIIMVGDSLHDMHAGRAAGALCVAVTTGMADGSTLAPHADHVLAGISGLPALIASITRN